MKKEPPAHNASTSMLWKLFVSVKLTVCILTALALTSIIGTLIPQNGSPSDYIRKYSEHTLDILITADRFLNIFDMYHSWWFYFLIILLALNIIICSIDRLSHTWKIIFTKHPKFNLSRFQNNPDNQSFAVSIPPEHLAKLYAPTIARLFSFYKIEPSENTIHLFAEKGRKSRLGVYLVHFSIILLLCGSLIGSRFGFDGFVNITEGEMADHIQYRNSEKTIPLDFSIQCNAFSVSFYESGAPKEYRSSLSIIENGNPVFTKDIIVNDPLRYKGINIFQSSYGSAIPDNITVNFTSRESGMIYTEKTDIGKSTDIPEGMGKFVLESFKTNYHFMGHNIGEVFIGTLTPTDGEPVTVIIPFPFPDIEAKDSRLDILQIPKAIDSRQELDITITIKKTGEEYKRKMVIGKEIDLPEGIGKLIINEPEDAYEFQGHNLGQTFTGKLVLRNGTETDIFLPIRFPNFDKMRNGDIYLSIDGLAKQQAQTSVVVSVSDFNHRYFTGLQVTKDPGVFVVYAGFIFIILGCYMTFFISHQQICIEMKNDGNQTKVTIAGHTNKNKLGMQNKVKRLSAKLSKLTKNIKDS